MSLDSWNSVFQVLSVVLLGATFVVGTGALWTGKLINRRQADRLVTLETDLTNAKIELGKQQERAAKAEKDLLEIKERTRPRTISTDARTILLDRLQIGSHTAPIRISFVGGSTNEPFDFAKQIADVLSAAGWRVTHIDGGPALGNPTRGIVLRLIQGSADAQALILKDALDAAGIGAIVTHVDESRLTFGEIELEVGLKP